MDLRQLSHRNRLNDWCTEYTGSEILGRYCSMSARDLGFRGDSGYDNNNNNNNVFPFCRIGSSDRMSF